jgi:hypothetical protein
MQAMLDGLYLKMLDIVELWMDFVQKLPVVGKKLLDDDTKRTFQNWKKGFELHVKKEEKDNGITGDLSAFKEREVGLSEKDKARVLQQTKLTGKQPLINIQKVEIKQDFRDQDPDDVIYEMTKGFERLSEAAVQSLVGRTATTYGPGASYGGG